MKSVVAEMKAQQSLGAIIAILLVFSLAMAAPAAAKKVIPPAECGSWYWKNGKCYLNATCNGVNPCQLSGGIPIGCPYPYHDKTLIKKDGKYYHTCSLDPVFNSKECGAVAYSLMLRPQCKSYESCNGYDMCSLFTTMHPTLYSYYGVTCPDGYEAQTIGTEQDSGWYVATCHLAASQPNPPCTNECNAGDRVCDGNGYKVCGNYDSDSCTEWSDVTTCGANEICSSGMCIAACTNECSSVGERRCSSTWAYQVCGNYDTDACLEWGTPASCSASETCSNGVCVYSGASGGGSGGGGGGGSSGPYPGFTFGVTLPVIKNLMVKDTLSFVLDGQRIYVKLTNLTATRAYFLISPQGIETSLPLEGKGSYNVIGDSANDIAIEFLGTDGVTATVKVKEAENVATENGPESETQTSPGSQASTGGQKQSGGFDLLPLAFFILLLLAIPAIFYLSSKDQQACMPEAATGAASSCQQSAE